jgi:hypothetical protein
MAGLSYAQVLTGDGFDLCLLHLEPPLVTLGGGNEDALEGCQGPLSQTIKAHMRSCTIDHVKHRLGEKLPEGSYRNYVGFLIHENTCIIKIDEANRFHWSSNYCRFPTIKLKSTMVIGCFMGKKPSALEFEAWLVALNEELNDGSAVLSHFEGRGFFSLEADSEET